VSRVGAWASHHLTWHVRPQRWLSLHEEQASCSPGAWALPLSMVDQGSLRTPFRAWRDHCCWQHTQQMHCVAHKSHSMWAGGAQHTPAEVCCQTYGGMDMCCFRIRAQAQPALPEWLCCFVLPARGVAVVCLETCTTHCVVDNGYLHWAPDLSVCRASERP